jgi:NADPH:quinone reductase-like Zn-dependent oxidoreductase
MLAVTLAGFGGPEVLRPAEMPNPIPDHEWAVIRLKASALNWHDVLVRQGRYNSALPHIPGADGAGIDTETGDEVLLLPSLWWGDDESAPGPRWEILGDQGPGTYAEFVRIPRECVVPKPPGLSWPEAAALPLVGLTTYRALFSRARLQPGESLLVLGAGGGVATMAVSLAAAAGCRVVVTSSSENKIARARDLGADAGVLYGDPGWTGAAKKLTPHGFDVVLDPVGSWGDSLSTLRPGGRLVVLGASRYERADLDVRPFYFGQFELIGTTMGSPRDFAGLLRFVEEHDVPPPVVDRTFALADAADAHRYLESGRGFGKVVLSP